MSANETTGGGVELQEQPDATPSPRMWDGNHGRLVFSDDLLPPHVGRRGRRAFAIAARHVDEMPNNPRYLEWVVQFAEAVDMFDRIQAAWIKLDCPLTEVRGTGATYEHPLLASMAKWKREIAAAGAALGMTLKEQKVASGGRPQGASSAADRKKPKARKL